MPLKLNKTNKKTIFIKFKDSFFYIKEKNPPPFPLMTKELLLLFIKILLKMYVKPKKKCQL